MDMKKGEINAWKRLVKNMGYKCFEREGHYTLALSSDRTNMILSEATYLEDIGLSLCEEGYSYFTENALDKIFNRPYDTIYTYGSDFSKFLYSTDKLFKNRRLPVLINRCGFHVKGDLFELNYKLYNSDIDSEIKIHLSSDILCRLKEVSRYNDRNLTMDIFGNDVPARFNIPPYSIVIAPYIDD